MLKNTSYSYGLITKLLHWIIGLAIITLLFVGFTMSNMPPNTEKWELYALHKASGVTLLMLIILRIIWRFINITVKAEDSIPFIMQLAAKIGHFFLYIFMLTMPISGILMSRYGGHDIHVFGLFVIPSAEKNMQLAKFFHSTHGFVAWGFSVLITVHMLAAFYHHFIRKDNTLIKMIK